MSHPDMKIFRYKHRHDLSLSILLRTRTLFPEVPYCPNQLLTSYWPELRYPYIFLNKFVVKSRIIKIVLD